MARAAYAMLLLLAFTASLLGQREYGFDNSKPSGQPYLTPEESLKRMKVSDGFEIQLFAAEPMVINPIAFTVDERGRVWVIESFEYPNRTPAGKMPRDRIVILEDTKGTGRADKRTVFAEGKDFPKRFDLASGIEVGYGGCFVGAAPYLWHLKDTKGTGKADSFEILLDGFGSQDTHEMLNTFIWGPDGWLYGLHGIFTNSKVSSPLSPGGRGVGGEGAASATTPIELDAGVWRYHPTRKKFELFAEGTSNPWGMDFDSNGNLFCCACVIPHLYHIIPGGIYRRQAGVSKNPYAYGELKEICDHTFHKESGWAHAGLLCLDTPIMPEGYRTSVIFGSIHGNSLKRNVLKPNGSTFTASKAPDFLTSGDKNFRPVGLRWGPGGAIYVSDFHDQNPCHQAKPDSWDYEHGRIYRIVRTKKPKTDRQEVRPGDFGKATRFEVHRIVDWANDRWAERVGLRILYDKTFAPNIKPDEGGWGAGIIRPLWVFADGAADPCFWRKKWLAERVPADEEKPYPYPVESWAAAGALLEDWGATNDEQLAFHLKLVKGYNEPQAVLGAACCALRRASDSNVLPLLHEGLGRGALISDPAIPLVLWLAYEKHLFGGKGRPEMLVEEFAWLQKNAPGNPLLLDYIVPRLLRRLVAAAAVNPAYDQTVRALVNSPAADPAYRIATLRGLVAGLREHHTLNRFDDIDLAPAISKASSEEKELLEALELMLSGPAGRAKALKLLADEKANLAQRIIAVQQMGHAVEKEALEPLIKLLSPNQPAELRVEALQAIANFTQPELARRILPHWKNSPDAVQRELLTMAKSRKPWAKDLLRAIGAGQIPRTVLLNNDILAIKQFNDPELDELIEKHWGRLRSSPAEIERLIDKMREEVRKGPADTGRGKLVFQKTCMTCHRFGGEGHDVGPALDGADRSVEYLLINILDPNRVVGQPYYSRMVLLKNGKLITGLPAGEDAQTITLKRENAVLEVIKKNDIEEAKTSDKSLMPEGLGYNLSVQDFRDLIKYLAR